VQFDDVAAVWKRMEAAGGAQVTMPLEKQFWGDVYGRFVDPFGISWAVSAPQSAEAEAPPGEA
jgi:PhnB protein